MIYMIIIETIKGDWVYRLPNKLKYNRYYGANRLSYQILCLLYYPLKTLILLLLSVYYYLFYGLYLVLKYFFDRETYYKDDCSAYDDYEDYKNNIIESEQYNDMSETKLEDSKLKLLWYFGSESEWQSALNSYDEMLGNEQRIIENYINNINRDEIKKLSAYEFYEFLYHKYFVWKYTQKNRLTTTRMNLKKYVENNELSKLNNIKERLFSSSKSDIGKCLDVATEIYGLGTAGASGLLAILFPEHFATVDQFVVKRLCEIEHPIYKDIIANMKPENLNNKDGVTLIKIMREKASELNMQFDTDFWTPRKIDMILWSFGR